jgi:hypothetical protein
MNIYREVLNRIEIPALPSLENGYYLLRFERNGTTSNVYAVVENESGMGVPITASVTEIGTGTPTPTDGEVLLAPGAWTLFFYEQVSGTNTNPDCSTIPLGQTEVTVYGEDAAVLSQTPSTCPGPGGAVTSDNVANESTGISGATVTDALNEIAPRLGLSVLELSGETYALTGLEGTIIAEGSGGAVIVNDGGAVPARGIPYFFHNTMTSDNMTFNPLVGVDGVAGAVVIGPGQTLALSSKGNGNWTVAGAVAAMSAGKVLRLLLNQSGTDDPTIVVLENTTGEAPTAERSGSVGSYSLFHSMIDPTTTLISPAPVDMVNNLTATYYNKGAGQVYINTADISSFPIVTPIDGLLDNTSIEIIIYP